MLPQNLPTSSFAMSIESENDMVRDLECAAASQAPAGALPPVRRELVRFGLPPGAVGASGSPGWAGRGSGLSMPG